MTRPAIWLVASSGKGKRIPMRQIDLVRIYATKTCLVVDDMSEIRGSISRMLKTFGVLHVDTVATGDDAIEICQQKHFDIVLCDYNLGPGKDGQQVLEELRHRNQLNNTSMFIMITAESARDMVLGALEYQPDDYVTKPITQNSLRTRLDRALIRHQELYNIKESIDRKDYEAAIGQCGEKLDGDTNYRSACLQIQAEMYLRTFNHSAAKDIYENVIEERPLMWAKLGMGKAQLAEKDYNDAEGTFKEIIGIDRRFVEAHDLLASSYLARDEQVKAQKAMEEAVDVSPKSVLRQRRLSNLAEKNQDMDIALKASRKTIKLGQNSCFESPEDYLHLTRQLADASKDDETIRGKEYAKEAFDVLRRLEKKTYCDSTAKLQSKSLKSRVSAGQHKDAEAERWMAEARSAYEDLEHNLSPEASIDFAESLISSGDKDAANSILKRVAKENPDNERVTEKVDAISDGPISAKGRQKVADWTKKGIAHYEAKQYPDAVMVFTNSLDLFPKHIGLNLNLVQAILADTKKNGVQEDYKQLSETALENIGSLEAADPQYARFEFLKKQVGKQFS